MPITSWFLAHDFLGGNHRSLIDPPTMGTPMGVRISSKPGPETLKGKGNLEPSPWFHHDDQPPRSLFQTNLVFVTGITVSHEKVKKDYEDPSRNGPSDDALAFAVSESRCIISRYSTTITTTPVSLVSLSVTHR